MRRIIPHESDPETLAELVERFGGALAPVVFDPECLLFRMDGVAGIIPYRQSLRCVVALGDPICDPDDMPLLLDGFRRRFAHNAFAGVGARFAAIADRRGYATIEFGEEVTLDPRRGLPHGRHGHGLRRKLNHARADGLAVREYHGTEAWLEPQLREVAQAWLAARHGMQVYVAHIDLFTPREARRWFYARRRGRVVGVLSLIHLGAKGGWLVEHLLPAPDSPVGTPELLVASALEALAAQGCGLITFGPSPADHLGTMQHLSRGSQWLGRGFFACAQRAFHLDSLGRFRKKFGPAQAVPSFLVFDPPRVGPFELYALMRAFNVSLA